MEFPRVLVISNVPFSLDNNAARTLTGLFEGWDPQQLAQLYFRPERPNNTVCKKYYQFTDADALKSVFDRKRVGNIIEEVKLSSEFHEDKGAFSEVYSYAHNNRSAFLTLARDMVWKFSAWKSDVLKRWISSFKPDVIFFVLGDGIFTYRIVNWISEEYRIPVVTVVYDDFFLGYDEDKGASYRLRSRMLNYWAHRTIDGMPYLFTTCEMMSRTYERIFDSRCVELYSAASRPMKVRTGTAISYFGNIGLGRWKQLIAIGKTLQKLGYPGVDVYTKEELPEILSQLTPDNGIMFHGGIPYEQVIEKTAESLAVIHTESFDAEIKERVRFSVSTKVADMLASGVCPLVYGPEDVASIDYFRSHDAGCVITKEEDLLSGLKQLLEDGAWRRGKIENALVLARQNHEPKQVRKRLLKILTSAAWGEGSL